METAASDLGVCCSPGCGVVLQNRRECPICKEMKIPGSFFCSKDCYKKNWQKHKKIHKTSSKSKAEPEEIRKNASEAKVICVDPGDAEVSLVTLMKEYDLKSYGSYVEEKNELKRDLGWTALGEVKFYPKEGCQWYFFGYYDKGAKKKGRPLNRAVSKASCVDVYGQCVILPSGPVGNEAFTDDAKIKFVELAESLAFYRDNDPKLVFAEREAARSMGPEMMMAGYGFPSGQACYVGGQPVFKTKPTPKGTGLFASAQL